MIKIIWFKNSHEQRLSWLKFGLMQLHHQRQIKFVEKNNTELNKENLHPAIVNHTHRHTVIIKVEKNTNSKFVLVDAEDSFFQLCPLIQYVDFYYCSAFNTDFFIHKKFDTQFAWQTAEDVEGYKRSTDELIENYSNYFHKVKKLFPIGPSLDYTVESRNYLSQKLINFKSKLYKWMYAINSWEESYLNFQLRYSQLLSYRVSPVQNDIVLLDSLWGWPEHRINLHKKLIDLSANFAILSELKFNLNDQTKHLDSSHFPMVSSIVGNDYELKLASSRLGVFATGFHFGWRNIMFFALMIGIPVYSDEIILEPYFNLKEFKIFWNKNQFENLEEIIKSISVNDLENIKKQNQINFDKYMSPLACAKYFVASL